MKAVKNENENNGEQASVDLNPSNAPEIKKPARLLVVVGVDSVTKQFVFEALVKIVSMSGFSVNATPRKELDGKEVEEDFHIIIEEEFDADTEIKASLVFGSIRNTKDVIQDIFQSTSEIVNGQEKALERFYNLSKWLRSAKLAFVLDFDSNWNKVGLHNFNNLKSMIVPLNFAFQRDTINGKEMKFDKMKPTELIEAIVPELKEQSLKAKEKFEAEKAKTADEKEIEFKERGENGEN
jgi:hypothetical protein